MKFNGYEIWQVPFIKENMLIPQILNKKNFKILMYWSPENWDNAKERKLN